jgi:hypothetical protein
MMPTFRTRVLLGACGAGALVLALGAPSAMASTSARTLVQRAIAATEATTTITYAGTIKEGKQTVSIRVSANEVTGEGQGTLTINGGTAQMRLVGGNVYLNADKTFWTLESGAQAATQLAGKWVSTAANGTNGQQLAVFVNGKDFLSQLFNPNLKNSTFTVTGTSTIGGKRATVISGRDTKSKSGGKVYVAKSGKPYILRIDISSKSGTGTITFSAFDKNVLPQAPANAINLDTAAGG